jgi:hypothetical protein
VTAFALGLRPPPVREREPRTRGEYAGGRLEIGKTGECVRVKLASHIAFL